MNDELVAMNRDVTDMTSDQIRAIQETQAAIIIAKKFPRDEMKNLVAIVNTCKRYSLAEVAFYSYPRGKSTVRGPSVHLARAIAGQWGNLQFGIREIMQLEGESFVEAFCWDQERNNKQTLQFWVKHERHVNEYSNGKKTGKMIVNHLTDPRDIYELVANNGARRLRKCILDCIPGDVVDAAKKECEATLRKGDGATLKERLTKFLQVFGEKGVTKEMLDEYLGHPFELSTEQEGVDLKAIFNSLKDGETKPQDWFGVKNEAPKEGEEKEKAMALREKLLKKE